MGLFVVAELFEFKQNKKWTSQNSLETSCDIVIIESETVTYKFNSNWNGDKFDIVLITIIAKVLEYSFGIIESGLAVSICFHFFNKSRRHSW